MTDTAAALLAGALGTVGALIGALIGAFAALQAARATRESDRRKRCVDRVLTATTQLDKAYAQYVTTVGDDREDLRVVLPLQGALREYSQAIAMLTIESLRNAATRYQTRLTEFYLMFGVPRDDLDADREVPTLQQLNAEHAYLADKLRRYEGRT